MTDERDEIVRKFHPGKRVSFYHDGQWWWGIVKHAYKTSYNAIEFMIVPGDDLFPDDNPESRYMQRRAIRVHVVASRGEISEKVHREVRRGWIDAAELPMPNY